MQSSQKGFTPVSSIVEIKKITEIILFIFLAPIIGMTISIFITIVTIIRNTWYKIAIIIVAAIITWFLFAGFEQTKIRENVSKYYQVEALKKRAKKIY